MENQPLLEMRKYSPHSYPNVVPTSHLNHHCALSLCILLDVESQL